MIAVGGVKLLWPTSLIYIHTSWWKIKIMFYILCIWEPKILFAFLVNFSCCIKIIVKWLWGINHCIVLMKSCVIKITWRVQEGWMALWRLFDFTKLSRCILPQYTAIVLYFDFGIEVKNSLDFMFKHHTFQYHFYLILHVKGHRSYTLQLQNVSNRTCARKGSFNEDFICASPSQSVRLHGCNPY